MAFHLDLQGWKRRRHFEFFRRYEQPFFNLCAEVEVGDLVEHCRRPGGPSFFLAALWCSLAAVNEVEEFRYRLRGERVLVHDRIHGGTTVLMPNETFAFAYFDWTLDFERFHRLGREELDRVRSRDGDLEPADDRDDLIHYSVIPWIRFTSFSHARDRIPDDSVPKIVFGRYGPAGGGIRMPVSVEVHHALMDGLHVGRFFERFEEYLRSFPRRTDKEVERS